MKPFQRVTAIVVALVFLVGAATLVSAARKTGDAWMGVFTQTVDRDLAKAFDLKSPHGVIVNEVIDDSPADKAGLEKEDIILTINGNHIEDSDELGDMVEEAQPGDKMNLGILRDGKEMQVSVTLGDQADEKHSSRHNVFMPKMPRIPTPPRTFSFYSNRAGSYIGVSLTDLNEQLGNYFGVKDGDGVLISEVEEDSPAAKAGLKAGDVIVGIDGEDISNPNDVSDIIQDTKAGKLVSVEVLRDRRPLSIKVTVEKRKGEDTYGYNYNYNFGNGDNTTIPGVPNLRGNFKQLYDSKDFKEQMEDLRKQMDELKQQLQDNDSWREDLRKMKEDLRSLQEKSH